MRTPRSLINAVFLRVDFFNREGERFVREDPLLPFSNSVLTDITQNQDQSWLNEHETESPGGSTTTFFMAKSSTPDEMLNALLSGTNRRFPIGQILHSLSASGKHDALGIKENHPSTKTSRTMTNGWNEYSALSNKKSLSGLNLRQQKDSPFNEVNIRSSRRIAR